MVDSVDGELLEICFPLNIWLNIWLDPTLFAKQMKDFQRT